MRSRSFTLRALVTWPHAIPVHTCVTANRRALHSIEPNTERERPAQAARGSPLCREEGRLPPLSLSLSLASRLSVGGTSSHAPPLTTHQTHTQRNQTDSGAEIATLQAQHQERLQKIVEAHNQDLTLLQETYQACAARLKDTDAALAEEKRRVADLERARQDLAAAQLAAKPAPPPSTDVPTDVPATQPEEHRGSEEASTIRRLKEENDGLKQRVMALQQQHDLQQDAMAKVPSTPMLLFSLSQAYSCTSY